MTDDVESQRHLLPENAREMPKWEEISNIIDKDEDQELRTLLQQKTIEAVVRPQDAPHSNTALHEVIEKNAIKCFQVLLESKEKKLTLKILDSSDADGNSPLHVAVEKLNSRAVEELLKAGANPNVCNDRGHTALHLLAYSASSAVTFDELTDVMKCTDLLLSKPSIQLDAVNISQNTPLRAAAERLTTESSSLKEFCRKLINKGAIVDEETKKKLDRHGILNII